MNLQDVSKLLIPEGEVRTIHDSSNKLLWGRVNYDTKYAGDATQEGVPSPDQPKTVNVVTGVQNIMVSDSGGNPRTFIVDLGSTELCKIDTYQDKIYKSSSGWYIHKECSKSSVNTNNITLNSNYSNIEYAQIPKPSDSVFYGNYQEMTYPLMFTHAEHIAPSGGFNKSDWYGKIFMSAQTNRYWVGFVKGTGLDTIKTDLSGAKLYYPMANSTEVQIVGTNLISQLNHVHEWLTRYGYNATVSGDLPIVIEKTNLP